MFKTEEQLQGDIGDKKNKSPGMGDCHKLQDKNLVLSFSFLGNASSPLVLILAPTSQYSQNSPPPQVSVATESSSLREQSHYLMTFSLPIVLPADLALSIFSPTTS